MAFTLGLHDHDKYWLETQTVRLEIRKKGAPDAMLVERAKRRNVTQREIGASNGIYTGSDVNWHLPARFLPADVKPFPGCVVEEEDGSRWTALDVAFNRIRNTWKLVSRNLAIHLQLGDRIDVERPALVYDAAGVARQLFPSGDGDRGGKVLYPSLLARVQPETDETIERHGIQGQVGRYRVIVSKQLYDLDTGNDRIKWTDRGVTRYLTIRSYSEAENIGALPVIAAELAP